MTEKEFLDYYMRKITAELGVFPQDYCETTDLTEVEIKGRSLKLGSEFFGKIVLLNAEGEQVYLAENYEEAKFILYAFRFSPKIKLPRDAQAIRDCVKDYEKKLDAFVREIKEEIASRFGDKIEFTEVTNKIFRKLNLQRH